MRNHCVVLSLVTAAVAGSAFAQDKQTGTLKYRPYKSFDFVMPQEVWTKVTSGLGIKNPSGDSYKAARTGLKLEVDTTGDGRLNDDVRGQKGYLLLRSEQDKGFAYAVRFKGDGKGYEYAASGAMTGSVGGVHVQVFDLNNNGLYNEYGVDAMIVGKGKSASYLSKVISDGGKLYNFEVSENGVDVAVSPYHGDAGTINLTSGFASRGKLESAVVSDGSNSFNVSDVSDLTVPVGDYTIVAGFVKKGSQTARIRAGKMTAIKVKPDAASKFEWGGPVIAEFTHSLEGGEVKVEPTNLKFYGKSGEEYFDWFPNAKSPKFTVRHPETGKEVASFIFGGC